MTHPIPNASEMLFSKGGFKTPFSVIMPVIKFGGVRSNAGLKTLTPFGAILLPPILTTSSTDRSSITILSGLSCLNQKWKGEQPHKMEYCVNWPTGQPDMFQSC